MNDIEVTLPEGWVAAFDDNYKRTYYYDMSRRKATWTLPQSSDSYDSFERTFSSSGSTSSATSPQCYRRSPEKQEELPSSTGTDANVYADDPWVELYSEEHERKYYYNRRTKESAWHPGSDNVPEVEEESPGEILEDIPALQSAWNQIEKAREDIKREREEISGRLRTDAKLLHACLEEFKRLRKAYAFTPNGVPNEGVVAEGGEEEADIEGEEGEEVVDSLRSELDKYSMDIEKRTAQMDRSVVDDSEDETEESDGSDIDVEKLKARHRRRVKRKQQRTGPASMVVFMDMEEEIKGVIEEMKAREQAKVDAAQVKEGDYYRVLGVKKNVSASSLKRAYHKMMIKWHPDKNPERLKEATENANTVSDAYTVLSDAWERQIYDNLGLESYLIHARTLQAFKNYMWSGIKIKKHGRKGKRYGIKGMVSFYPAKRRFLWLGFHGDSINTGPVRILEPTHAKDIASIKSVSMASITGVKKGMSTEVFQRTGIYSRQGHYLSVISPERTLDIETESKEQRDFLATRLNLLVYDTQKNKEKLIKHYKENPIKKKKMKKRIPKGRR